MVAWRVSRAIIDLANRTVLQLMTSRYSKLLLANGACVARLTCVSLCQFKELVRSTARFLTFRILFDRQSLSFTRTRSTQCIVFFFPIFAWLRLLWNAIVSACNRGTLSRLHCPGYIYFSNQRRNLVSLRRLSRLCLVNLFSSLTDFSDYPLPTLYTLYTLYTLLCLYSRIRSCAYQRHVTTLVSAIDATSQEN